MFNQRFLMLCLFLSVAIFSGCDDLQKAVGSSAGSNTASENAAEAKLKTCLDAWKFGDSETTIKASHKIDFMGHWEPGTLGLPQLLDYSIGQGRPAEDTTLEGKKVSFQEFVVNLTYTTKGGTEVKRSQIFSVRDMNDGTWLITAREK